MKRNKKDSKKNLNCNKVTNESSRSNNARTNSNLDCK